MAAARNIAEYTGRSIDDDNHSMDARLPDGSRVHVIVPPSSRNGCCISIRKFKKSTFNLASLVKSGSMSDEAQGVSRPGRAAAQEHGHRRRHRQRQDVAAQRPVGRNPRERADRRHRRQLRAAAPSAAHGVPRSPAGKARRHRPRDDSRPVRRFAAHAAGPDRGRRNPPRRGARPGPIDDFRPRRLAHHRACHHGLRRGRSAWKR